jgi:membrane protein implicated in regulation of membrane protease activity
MNKFGKIATNSAVGNFIFIVLGSLAFMVLTPVGSLNPKEFGFYWSIITALIINLLTVYLIRRYQKKNK